MELMLKHILLYLLLNVVVPLHWIAFPYDDTVNAIASSRPFRLILLESKLDSVQCDKMMEATKHVFCSCHAFIIRCADEF